MNNAFQAWPWIFQEETDLELSMGMSKDYEEAIRMVGDFNSKYTFLRRKISTMRSSHQTLTAGSKNQCLIIFVGCCSEQWNIDMLCISRSQKLRSRSNSLTKSQWFFPVLSLAIDRVKEKLLRIIHLTSTLPFWSLLAYLLSLTYFPTWLAIDWHQYILFWYTILSNPLS